MENLKIEVEETMSFKQRMKSLFFWRFLIITGFVLVLYIYLEPRRKIPELNALFAFSYLFFILILLSILYCYLCSVYSITLLEIKENGVHLIYKKRNESLELKDSIEKFEFSYSPGYQGMPQFLRIKYDGQSLLRQYKVLNWKKEGFFDQTKKYLRERKLFTSWWNF